MADTLVYFGNHNLQKSPFTVSYSDWKVASSNMLQTQPLARVPGVSVVSSKLDAKTIEVSGTVHTDTNLDSMQKVTKEFDSMFNTEDYQYLRIVPDYVEAVPTDSISNWTAYNDAVSLSLLTDKYQVGSSSVGFNIDVSNSGNHYADFIYSVTAGNGVDLSSYSDTGNLELWVNIPDAFYVTSIEFLIGNDASNYYFESHDTDYQGKRFQNGPILLSSDWANMSETGTVDDSDIRYCYIKIIYESDAVDVNDCYIDGIQWVNEETLRNFPVRRIGPIKRGGEHYGVSFTQFQAKFLNHTGYAIGTHSISLFDQDNITGTTNVQKFDLDGSTAILPKFQVDVTTATAIADFSIQNLNNNQQVDFVPSTIAADDIFELGGEDRVFTKNGQTVDFDGIIPSFLPGTNRTRLIINGSIPTTLSYDTDDGASSTLSNANDWAAISFVAPATGDIVKVDLVLSSTFTTATKIALYSDSSGSPGSQLDESFLWLLRVSKGTESFTGLSWSVTNSTTYWIVLKGVNGSTINWYGDSAGGNGTSVTKRSTSAGSSWTTSSKDLTFDIQVGPTPAWDIDWSATYKKLYLA